MASAREWSATPAAAMPTACRVSVAALAQGLSAPAAPVAQAWSALARATARGRSALVQDLALAWRAYAAPKAWACWRKAAREEPPCRPPAGPPSAGPACVLLPPDRPRSPKPG